MRLTPIVLRALAAVCAAAAVPAFSRAAVTFETIGTFWVAGVSDDGNTVAGTGHDPAAPGQVMVLWTPTTGLRTAGWSQGHEHTTAHAISGDGSILLGVDYNANMLTWTAAGGVQYPSGTNGYPGGINRDGSVLVGGHVGGAPFRWTAAGGAVSLPTPAGWENGHGNAVSADGSVVAGALFEQSGRRRAFRWTGAGGTQLLDQPVGIVGSEATAISADGSTVVGWSYDANDIEHAFRWTEAGGFQLLGHLPGFPNTRPMFSQAADVTADGSIVVGNESWGLGGGNGGAFIWDATHGLRLLQDVLAADYGLDLSGWRLGVTAITPDGNTLIGSATSAAFPNGIVYRVVLPEPGAAAAILGASCLCLRRRRA